MFQIIFVGMYVLVRVREERITEAFLDKDKDRMMMTRMTSTTTTRTRRELWRKAYVTFFLRTTLHITGFLVIFWRKLRFSHILERKHETYTSGEWKCIYSRTYVIMHARKPTTKKDKPTPWLLFFFSFWLRLALAQAFAFSTTFLIVISLDDTQTQTQKPG